MLIVGVIVLLSLIVVCVRCLLFVNYCLLFRGALPVSVYLLFVASSGLFFVVARSFVVFCLLRVDWCFSWVVVVGTALLLVVWRCVPFVVCGLLLVVSSVSSLTVLVCCLILIVV